MVVLEAAAAEGVGAASLVAVAERPQRAQERVAKLRHLIEETQPLLAKKARLTSSLKPPLSQKPKKTS